MGSPNGYFHNRMDTASELWKDGKATVFIVSGDNSSHAYNEPEWMKQALVERGVPEERIVCDFAGLRTLDSVVRMKEIFGVSTMIVVSQEFHNERALAIAAHEGMAALGRQRAGCSQPPFPYEKLVQGACGPRMDDAGLVGLEP